MVVFFLLIDSVSVLHSVSTSPTLLGQLQSSLFLIVIVSSDLASCPLPSFFGLIYSFTSYKMRNGHWKSVATLERAVLAKQ